MAFPFRHLISRNVALVIVTFAATAFVAGFAAHAQPTAPAPVPAQPAVFQLYATAPLGDLFYEAKGRTVSVNVGHHAFSAPAIAPPDGKVSLYRFKPAAEPGLPAVRVPVISASVSVTDAAQTLLLIYAEGPPPPDGTVDTRPLRSLTLDQSPAAFPEGTIRVFSFSTRPVAVKVGTSAVPVPPMQAVSIPYPGDKRAWLHIATVGEQGWQRVIGTAQTLGTRTRLSLFLRDIAPSQYDPKPVGLLLGKVLEPVPAPAQP